MYREIHTNPKYNGFIHEMFSFVEDNQLLNQNLWDRFVHQFRFDSDYDAGWRGEYWGKMMRGAAFVYSYTKNPTLYDILCHTVEDILTTQDSCGRISTYDISHEFDGWDMWGRKYVLLGMEYFLDICKDDKLKKRVVDSMCFQLDYIISKIGDKSDGKLPITQATRHWRGLNSCSVLQPVVKLYNITKNEKYLEFARYIVDTGATDVENIFNLAYENKFYPYQYPVTKAYEMISCFEGLLEFYLIDQNDRYKTALINFADRILESDFTIIGCAGCTHELFDHSTVRQANTTNGDTMQETCVTVTLMHFFYEMNLLTGLSKYADAFERSFYNAYRGSFNTEKVVEKTVRENENELVVEPMPFDSYSPLTSGTRGNGIGGFKIMNDNHYYGCCACIGSMGIGLLSKLHIVGSDEGFVMNMYIDGYSECVTQNGNKVKFITETDYPKYGRVNLKVCTDNEEKFKLKLRIPSWSKDTKVMINKENISVTEGYVTIDRLWSLKDVVTIDFDMRCEAIYPIPYGHEILMNKVVWGKNYMVSTYDEEDKEAKNHIALRYGPLMLCQDMSLGYDTEKTVSVKVNNDGYVDITLNEDNKAPFSTIINAYVPLNDNASMLCVDYSSAGKKWNDKIAVWIKNQ